MPTPEEGGVQKPRKGPCENCGKSGRRRSLNGGVYVLCTECQRAMGAGFATTRPKRHRHGGRPGALR